MEVLAELEEGLLEVVSGPVGVALGPEVGEDPISAESLFVSQADQSQQRQRPLSGDRSRQRAILIFDGEPAEGPEAQHFTNRERIFNRGITVT